MTSIYLDHNATTPLHPAVRAEFEAALREVTGNPSSLHREGRAARGQLESSRRSIAELLGVEDDEIYFTSGGTEGNNLVLQGRPDRDRPLWISAVEHPSVLEPARRIWRGLESRGLDPGGVIPVNSEGRLAPPVPLDPAHFRGALVSIQWVNNETGVVQDLARWARVFRDLGAHVHTDGAQGFYRIPVDLRELPIDAATITGHKSFGPPGVGIVVLRRGFVIDPLLAGGPQERRVRPGTENVPAVRALARLASLTREETLWPLEPLEERYALLRGELEGIPGCTVVTPHVHRFPNVVCACFEHIDSDALVLRLDALGVTASSGSACSSGAGAPSTALRAMGVADELLGGALRLSFAAETPLHDLARAAAVTRRAVEELRRVPRPPGPREELA